MSINYDAMLSYVSANKGATISARDPKLALMGPAADEDAFMSEISPVPQVGDASMSGSEWKRFIQFYVNSFRVHFPQRDWQIFDRKFPAAAMAVLAAKQTLKGTVAESVQDGDLIVSQIRPETIFASTAATYNFIQTATAGWQAAYWTIDLNTATGGSTIRTPQNRVSMIVLALADFASSPKILGYQWKESGTTPYGIRYNDQVGIAGGTNVLELAQAINIGANKKFTLDVNFSAAGQTILTPLGIQLSTQDYATSESA